jgi:hypothetical protein
MVGGEQLGRRLSVLVSGATKKEKGKKERGK